MNKLLPWTLLVLFCFLEGCASNQRTSQTETPELKDLGSHRFKITTSSPAAQLAFNRGLNLAYSFGHYAAEQEFRKALKADPDCAMAYWGVALVNGPHINFPLVPPDKAATAWESVTQAKRLIGACSPLEQALVKALESRYANPQPEDRASLDIAYAAAMWLVAKQYHDNPEATTLFAEAAMDLHPWDFWTNGLPQPWTLEILDTLEQALRIDPRHPGANHFYIHVVEGSPNPRRAILEADRLRRLVPDSSHMVHMPSHIYSRVGRWQDAAQANLDALKADKAYRAAYPRPGLYSMYMAHNAHFLAWVSMMQGRNVEALRCARLMVSEIPNEFLNEYAAIADGYMAIVPETLMRFGRWEEILREPEPGQNLLLARALCHYSRAVALTALNRKDQARTEQDAFAKAVRAVPQDRMMGNNSASEILAIAALVLNGEIRSKQNDFDGSISELQQAVGLEDKLKYDEPPDWIQPVRHTLGAVLLAAKRPSEAETVYRQELERNPENGWSLLGLRDSLRSQGKQQESQDVDARLKKAWAKADISPKSTCYCQQAK